MTQRELNRAVARATGESVQRIHRAGFGLLTRPRPQPYWRRARRRPVQATLALSAAANAKPGAAVARE